MYSSANHTLQPALAEKFEGIIWKIETDDAQTVIAIETRDTEKHTASFSAFDFQTGECFFKEYSPEDSWNWGLDRVHHGYIFLHGYLRKESPEHKGIICLGQTGQTVWQLFNKTLDTISEKGLIAYNPSVQPRMPELLAPETGLVLQHGVKQYDPLRRDIILPEILNDTLLFSHLLPPDITGPVLHTSFHGKDCFSFHIPTDGGYTQKLLVYQQDTLILDEILAAGIQKLNPEAFFIQHSHLFCIRNGKREILSYLV